MPEQIYGPYLRKDGRKHVIRVIRDDEGAVISRRTQSYPRYLIEEKIGSPISSSLTVDHVNRDKTDDNIDNFRLLSLSDHLKDDAVYRKNPVDTCESCGVEFGLSRHQTSTRARSKPGPFCSKSCASKKISRNSEITLRASPQYYQREK